MKISKAKVIIKDYALGPASLNNNDLHDALRVGISAINRVQDWRLGKVLNPSMLLDGETDEPDSPPT